jgi:hypothetical protein
MVSFLLLLFLSFGSVQKEERVGNEGRAALAGSKGDTVISTMLITHNKKGTEGREEKKRKKSLEEKQGHNLLLHYYGKP